MLVLSLLPVWPGGSSASVQDKQAQGPGMGYLCGRGFSDKCFAMPQRLSLF
jgi:hypothetical protein